MQLYLGYGGRVGGWWWVGGEMEEGGGRGGDQFSSLCVWVRATAKKEIQASLYRQNKATAEKKVGHFA